MNNQKTKRFPQYLAGLAAAGGAMATGAALGWPSPAGPRLIGDLDDDGRFFPITEEQFEWVSSIITVGCAISCLPVGYLQNRFGRKWTMIGLVAPFIVGWGLVIWAQNLPMLIAGRVFLGIAGGAFCMLAPAYAGEIAEKEIRGIIGTFMQLLINTGILLAYVVGAFTSVFYMSIVCGAMPILFAIVFFFMPESPVYLVSKKQIPESVITYKWLRGEAYNPQWEIDELTKELEESKAQAGSFKDEVWKTATRRAMAISFGVMFFQQLCGINVVVFSVRLIFEAAETDLNNDYQAIAVGTVLLFSTLIGSFLVDRLGRKILMVLSSLFMSIMLMALGVFFWLQDNHPEASADLAWLPITSLSLFLIAYSVGYGPLPWLIMSEVYSTEVKSVLGPITGSFCWLLAFVVTVTFGYISQAIGLGGTFWMFGGVTFLGIPFGMFVLVETKGRTMSEIQRLLAGEKIL